MVIPHNIAVPHDTAIKDLSLREWHIRLQRAQGHVGGNIYMRNRTNRLTKSRKENVNDYKLMSCLSSEYSNEGNECKYRSETGVNIGQKVN